MCPFLDFAISYNDYTCFKFIENGFWFSDEIECQKGYAKNAQLLIDYIENKHQNLNITIVSAAINILGVIYYE